jgi:hypothetical protein
MRHEVEVGAPIADADPGGPAEVVDRQGFHAQLGEAQGQLLVVVVQAANVGQDDHGPSRAHIRAGVECSEAGAVGRVQR